MGEEEADEAGFEEEGEGFVLDDFFRGADFFGEGFEHSDAGAAESGAKNEGLRVLEDGGDGDFVEAEADVGGFGNVAFEISSFLLDVVRQVGQFRVGLEVIIKVIQDVVEVGDDGFWRLVGGRGFGGVGVFGSFCVFWGFHVFGSFGEGAEVDDAEGELVDGFCDGGGESLGGGAEVGESSLEAERKEEGGDRDDDKRGAELTADESEDEEDEEGDGVGVDGAAGEGEEEGGREEEGEEGEGESLPSLKARRQRLPSQGRRARPRRSSGSFREAIFRPDESWTEDEEVEGGQSRGEEEVAHELGFDGEAGGVRKAKGAVGTAGAEEGFAAGEAAGIEDALDETEDADSGGGEEK